MNKGMLTVGIILLSLIALLLLNVLTNYSTGSELDYYLVKETTDAAIIDSLDADFYSECGLRRLDKERFVENFLYRFAKSVDVSRDYKIAFYDINEVPPKVSVKIDSLTVLSMKNGQADDADRVAADITTSYDAIVESTNTIDPVAEAKMKIDYDACKEIIVNKKAKEADAS